MQQEKRKRQRIIPPDFKDFAVRLQQGDLTMIGVLGNISEDGVLALIPGQSGPVLGKDAILDGLIRSNRLSADLPFRARKVWAEQRLHHGEPYHFIGMQFIENVDLPDTLIAFELAAEILD